MTRCVQECSLSFSASELLYPWVQIMSRNQGPIGPVAVEILGRSHQYRGPLLDNEQQIYNDFFSFFLKQKSTLFKKTNIKQQNQGARTACQPVRKSRDPSDRFSATQCAISNIKCGKTCIIFRQNARVLQLFPIRILHTNNQNSA